MNEIERAIRDFIRTNFVMGLGSKQLGTNDSLMETGVIDSTGVLELTGFLEEKFAIRVADEDLVPENLDTLSNIVGFIERKTATAAG